MERHKIERGKGGGGVHCLPGRAVCTYTHAHTRAHTTLACVRAHTRVCVHVQFCACVRACLRVRACACVGACARAHARMCTFVCACERVSLRACVRVCVLCACAHARAHHVYVWCACARVRACARAPSDVIYRRFYRDGSIEMQILCNNRNKRRSKTIDRAWTRRPQPWPLHRASGHSHALSRLETMDRALTRRPRPCRPGASPGLRPLAVCLCLCRPSVSQSPERSAPLPPSAPPSRSVPVSLGLGPVGTMKRGAFEICSSKAPKVRSSVASDPSGQ